jgi:hypothetical protein
VDFAQARNVGGGCIQKEGLVSSIFKFICKHCGPSDDPCEHVLEHEELKLLREIFTLSRITLERIDKNQGTLARALQQIIRDLNRPQSATLKLSATPPDEKNG